jgi:2-alkenal reductase
LIELYRQVNPAVVNIITYADQGSFQTSSGQGSGFVYDNQGRIVTNSHVVHGADAIEVVFSDNTTLAADLVGEDLHSDLAVIQVSELPAGVQPLPLGDINEVAVGQTVVAIGNPFGLGGTLTRGVVSALGRSIPALTAFSIPQAIQTDAPINPGNSGGPLLNLRGQVIGVNAQIETGDGSRVNSGVGFAIPVSIVERVIPSLIENGEYQWGWLGVVGGTINPTMIEAMNLPVQKGAYISQIVQNGPADQAGLRGSTDQIVVDGRRTEIGGDIIVAINGQPVSSFDDILIYIALNTQPGQDVILTILRDGKMQDVKVTLRPRPSGTRESLVP